MQGLGPALGHRAGQDQCVGGEALMAHPSRDKEGQKGSRTSGRPQAGMR